MTLEDFMKTMVATLEHRLRWCEDQSAYLAVREIQIVFVDMLYDLGWEQSFNGTWVRVRG